MNLAYAHSEIQLLEPSRRKLHEPAVVQGTAHKAQVHIGYGIEGVEVVRISSADVWSKRDGYSALVIDFLIHSHKRRVRTVR